MSELGANEQQGRQGGAGIIRIYAELPPAQISRLRFLTEAMDNLACVSVLNPWRSTVRITAPSGQRELLLAFLKSVQSRLGLRNIYIGA